MKRMWRAACAAGLFGLALNASPTRAQIGGAPVPAAAAPAAAAGAAPAAAAAGAAEAKQGFFMKLCKTLDECRRKLCMTPTGQLLNSMSRPAAGLTGGVIPSFCPAMPSDKDLAQPGVAGAADAAKKDALEAKMRREKVRFLGTLDCRYYPDAIGALVAALRTDSSECVRYEAALGLGHGCCCNQKTVDALEASVSGTDKDGNPAERSARVRCAAAVALERCLACYTPPPPDVEPKPKDIEKLPKTPESTPDGTKPDTLPTPGKLPVDPKNPDPDKKTGSRSNMPDKATVERALRTLNEFNTLLAAAQPPAVMNATYTTPGRQSVYHLLKATAEEPGVAYAMPRPMPQPTMTAPAAPAISAMATMPTAPALAPAPAPAPAAPSAPAQPAAVLGPPLVPAQPMQSPEPTKAPAPVLMPAPKTAPAAPVAPATPPAAVLPPRESMVKPAAVLPPRETMVKPAAAVATPPQPRPAATPVPSMLDEVNKCATLVLYAPTPAERHAAIRQLVKYDWKQHPLAASTLLTGAKTDTNNVVRVDCLRHMVAYRMNHPQVLADLTAMTADADPWVRQEAAEALAQLKQIP